jgi:hypothetical protein
MRRFALALAATVFGVAAAEAGGSPYPIHIERQRGSVLTIDHTPSPNPSLIRRVHRRKVLVKRKVRRAGTVVRRADRRRTVVKRVYRYSGIAGGCREGGYVRGQDRAGQIVTLQREVCYGIAELHVNPYGVEGGPPRVARPRAATARVIVRY